jgi:hypothetical protein
MIQDRPYRSTVVFPSLPKLHQSYAIRFQDNLPVSPFQAEFHSFTASDSFSSECIGYRLQPGRSSPEENSISITNYTPRSTNKNNSINDCISVNLQKTSRRRNPSRRPLHCLGARRRFCKQQQVRGGVESPIAGLHTNERGLAIATRSVEGVFSSMKDDLRNGIGEQYSNDS